MITTNNFKIKTPLIINIIISVLSLKVYNKSLVCYYKVNDFIKLCAAIVN